VVALLDLEPAWRPHGLRFLCPRCRRERLTIFFRNPIGGAAPVQTPVLFDRRGDTFATLTVSQSVACEPHWHGVIENGQCIDANLVGTTCDRRT